MRVAVVNNFFPPRAGGSAHLSEGIARKLAERGHDVLVVTTSFGDAPQDEWRDGMHVVRLPSRQLPKSKLTMRFDVNFATGPRNLRRLFRLLDEFAPDVVHQHGQFFDLTFLSSLYARRRGVPVVLSVHTRLEHTSRSHDLVLRLGDETLVRSFIALSAPQVVVMDRQMRDYVTTRYRIPPDRLVAIPVGVEPSRFHGDGSRVRQRFDLGDRPIVLSLGHVIQVRDRLALIEALPGLLDRWPTAVVLVVGIVYDDRFLTRADELGVRDHVVLAGGVPKHDVPDFLAAADVEAHDLQGYGLGTASLETMAAGVPVVASIDEDNFLGIQLVSGRHLVRVPLGDAGALADALASLITDRDGARRIGRCGRDLVHEHFTLDRVTDLHVALFERLRSSVKSST